VDECPSEERIRAVTYEEEARRRREQRRQETLRRLQVDEELLDMPKASPDLSEEKRVRNLKTEIEIELMNSPTMGAAVLIGTIIGLLVFCLLMSVFLGWSASIY
jgi:VIT1/CCC1 family predicted Fe2+/Mn2+ transporter